MNAGPFLPFILSNKKGIQASEVKTEKTETCGSPFPKNSKISSSYSKWNSLYPYGQYTDS